jgi:hypothetical protein
VSTTPPNNYRVVHPEVVRDRIRQWAGRAVQLGLRDWFRESLNHIEGRLSSAPTTWGDPLHQLPNLKLYVYRGLHNKFIVDYAVHEEARTVFVRQFRLMAGNPLEQG